MLPVRPGTPCPAQRQMPVSNAPLRGADRSVRSMLGAFPTAVLLVALIVLPAAAVSGPTKLLDPVAGPAAGTPTTTFSFAVTYRNREGSEPDHVQILVDGVAHVMATVDGTDWKAGVRFTWSSRLPVGTHEIEFRAMDRDRFTDSIAG